MSTAVAEYGLAPPAELDEKIIRADTLATVMESLTIATPDDYHDAAEYLKTTKSLIKEIEACFGPLKQKASEAHKLIVAEEKKQLAPLVAAELLVKRRMLGYQDEQNRIAQAEQRRLQAIADEKARKEREELERKAAAAKKPETKAKWEEAAAQVAPAPVIHVATAAPKVAGTSIRKTWKAAVVDHAAFFKFVCESKRDDLILVNDKALDSYAKSMAERASMPGVKFTEVSTLASGGR